MIGSAPEKDSTPNKKNTSSARFFFCSPRGPGSLTHLFRSSNIINVGNRKRNAQGTKKKTENGTHTEQKNACSQRSRSPFPERFCYSVQDQCRLETVVEEVEGCEDDCVDYVGNVLDSRHGLQHEGESTREKKSFQLGCFEWQQSVCKSANRDSATPQKISKEEPSPKHTRDCGSYFVSALKKNTEVFEISLNLQPRDVHKTSFGGKPNWTLNDKPKKRAGVQFRTLQDNDKLDFLRAMRDELGSYLEHEAVAIAVRHNVPGVRVLGMRWVLSWKAVTDEKGDQVGRKPKARLIIKGFQDPDLLYLKRDSPTLSTQNRNLLLSLAAAHKWRIYAGDIKTAFLNGDQTEAQREIFAEPPQDVRQMLGMKPHELFRILKAVYGLLHAPRAWADKLGKELRHQGWVQSRLEPCMWRLFEADGRLCGLLGVHVDDVLCCGDGSHFEKKMALLRQSFPFGSWKSLAEPVMCCGCELRQREDFSVELNQERYGESINEIP